MRRRCVSAYIAVEGIIGREARVFDVMSWPVRLQPAARATPALRELEPQSDRQRDSSDSFGRLSTRRDEGIDAERTPKNEFAMLFRAALERLPDVL